MKTTDMLRFHKDQKRQIKLTAYKIMLINMVAQNIADLFPKYWNITPWEFGAYGITITHPDLTVQDFEPWVKKLTRKFRHTPAIEIKTDYMIATWWLYPAKYQNVMVEFKVGNTEKCDFITTEELVKITKPSGYCAAVKERLNGLTY